MRLVAAILVSLMAFVVGMWVGTHESKRYCVMVNVPTMGTIPYCSPTPLIEPGAGT